MEHNLEDSLNLDSAVGEMGFEHGEETVESQVDITLETSQGDDIPMEFEHIEEQPMLMDTGNEEVIDFMGDQFPSFQEYSVQDEQHHDTASLVGEVNQLNVMSSQSETMIDLQFDSLPITSSIKEDYLPKIVAVKAAIPSLRAVKRTEAPRQVAIAPKPGRPPALAPKPVALVANRGLAKKVALSGIVQGNTKSSVLAQLGKQLVMVRSGVEQKIKLVAANTAGSTLQYVTTSSNQAQLISTSKPVNTSQTKPVMAKVIVQSSGQAGAEPCSQAAVLTRLAPGAPRYVMQQRTVPIPLHNQLLITSPTKQGVKVAKKQQIIAFKSPSGKLVSATQVPTTKKVVITANPSQNVILKSTAQPKTAQVNKDATVVTAGQRSQLHQIHVPGKGIQYIRLITNQTTALKPAATKQATLALPAKSFVLTDSKGNVIQMSSEKMVSEPPALLTTRSDTTARFAVKPQKKFVRIAPVPSKATSQAVVQPRAAQSLLAPLSPVGDAPGEETMAELLPTGLVKAESAPDGGGEGGEAGAGGESGAGGDGGHVLDTKDALRALVADTIASEHQIEELDIEFDHHQSPIEHEHTSSTDAEDSSQSQGPSLIMIPSYGKDGQGALPEDHSNVSQILEDSNGMVNEESESMRPYLSPRASQPLSDTDYVSNELGLRPRKACNCTKSQCLKLYCDCFANGEFCNQCNCNNCHNNLENEELRQKAIRACLDRNPNAFRPKIGKSKSSGPEVVRRHNKGCNCKRSGCLKNYCECYEAKIACTAMCKCVGCRNVEDTLEWRRDLAKRPPPRHDYRAEPHADFKQPCTFMTTEVIEAVCQCLLAAAAEGGTRAPDVAADPVSDVIDEFARCLQDIISASYQAIPLSLLDEGQT